MIKNPKIPWSVRAHNFLSTEINHINKVITVYTTRPDTLFGVTYMVLSPEHPLVNELVTKKNKASVDKYKQLASTKSDFDRGEINKDKTGVDLGAFAINPVSNEKISIWKL